MMARVRPLMAGSIFFASIWNVSMSVSTNTGSACISSTALIVATNVYGGTMTSSPGPMPRAASDVRRALVPFAVARQCLAPVSDAYAALEGRDLLAAEPLAAADDADERVFLARVRDRPRRERRPPHGCATEQRRARLRRCPDSGGRARGERAAGDDRSEELAPRHGLLHLALLTLAFEPRPYLRRIQVSP